MKPISICKICTALFADDSNIIRATVVINSNIVMEISVLPSESTVTVTGSRHGGQVWPSPQAESDRGRYDHHGMIEYSTWHTDRIFHHITDSSDSVITVSGDMPWHMRRRSPPETVAALALDRGSAGGHPVTWSRGSAD